VKLLLVAVSAFAVACASSAPEAPTPVTPAQTQTASTGLSVYEGTYAMQDRDRVLDLRVWLDAQGKLNGELVQLGQQTTFRPTSTEHRFLHATLDDAWFLFTVENGRVTKATMGQGSREITGPRKQ
jgi:opacity protein-like surface antigen